MFDDDAGRTVWDNVQPSGVIDVGAALTALEYCVQAPHEDRISGELMHRSLARLDANSCVLGELRIVGDVSSAPLLSSAAEWYRPWVTMGALFALRAADRADQAGLSWDRALFAAGRAVDRYLDLVPPAARQRLLEQYGFLPWPVYRGDEVIFGSAR